MKLIYSKIEPSRLLHLVHRLEEIESLSTKNRLAIVAPRIAKTNMPKDKI